MFVVDTNILIYAVNPDSPEHRQARDAIETWRTGDRSWFVTWGIIYEFMRVTTHPAVFPTPLNLPTAREWLAAVLASPRAGVLVETDRHWETLSELATLHPRLAGNPVHDLHTAALMKEHGISEIQTADTDFHQFQFLRVLNPVV